MPILTSLLRERLSPAAVCESVTRGPLGNGQETWFATARLGAEAFELVVRRTAAGGPLEWTDRAAEAAAMTAAAGAGLPVPPLRWVDAAGGTLGRPYLVMDRAPGEVATRAAGGDAVAVAAHLGRWLARLHAARLPVPGAPSDAATATRDELRRWRERYRRDRPGPVPQVGALLAWLESTVPDTAEGAVLLWGDPGPHNALHVQGRVTALLDWELAHAGHPLDDVGAAVWTLLRAPASADALVDAYERERGPVDRGLLDWFVTLAAVTRSIMVVTGAGAYVSGRTASPTLAALALQLPAEQLALAMTRAGWGCLEPPATPPPPPPAGLRPSGPEVDRGVARFLRDELLPTVEQPHLRRGLKAAVALLDSTALRAEADPGPLAGDDVEEAAERLEGGHGDADVRDRVRAQLVADLAAQRGPLEPLQRLLVGR